MRESPGLLGITQYPNNLWVNPSSTSKGRTTFFLDFVVRRGKRRMIKESKLETQKIGVECKSVWCRFINECEWFAEYVFIMPYLYTPNILGGCNYSTYLYRKGREFYTCGALYLVYYHTFLNFCTLSVSTTSSISLSYSSTALIIIKVPLYIFSNKFPA